MEDQFGQNLNRFGFDAKQAITTEKDQNRQKTTNVDPKTTDVDPKTTDVDPKTTDFDTKNDQCRFLNIHLYDLLDVLDLVDELHLCHPLVVLEPAD